MAGTAGLAAFDVDLRSAFATLSEREVGRVGGVGGVGEVEAVGEGSSSGVDEGQQYRLAGELPPSRSLTGRILDVYAKCNADFRGIPKLPQRLLTQPSDPVHNDGLDNAECNLICRVNDKLESESASYTILDSLGTGTFGQVFRCQQDGTKDIVAVKVIKNKPSYHNQGKVEIKVLRQLNNQYDAKNQRHIVRLLDSFEHRGHICLVFELLSMSLLDILTQNQFRGLPLAVVQRFTRQIVSALVTLEEASVIHCDLKPENLLLVPPPTLSSLPPPRQRKSSSGSKLSDDAAELEASSTGADSAGLDGAPINAPVPEDGSGEDRVRSDSDCGATTNSTTSNATTAQDPKCGGLSDIKVIDFGSACFEGQTVYSYIQSRFCKSSPFLT